MSRFCQLCRASAWSSQSLLANWASIKVLLRPGLPKYLLTDPGQFDILVLGPGWWGSDAIHRRAFIALATYLLLALTLAVGLPLVQANAVKNGVAVPATIIAMLVFAFKGSIDWTLGAMMGAGSIAGGVLGARLATSLQGRKWVFWLLVVVISAELVHLTVHYVFKTH
jgi:hypothetical protein